MVADGRRLCRRGQARRTDSLDIRRLDLSGRRRRLESGTSSLGPANVDTPVSVGWRVALLRPPTPVWV